MREGVENNKSDKFYLTVATGPDGRLRWPVRTPERYCSDYREARCGTKPASMRPSMSMTARVRDAPYNDVAPFTRQKPSRSRMTASRFAAESDWKMR